MSNNKKRRKHYGPNRNNHQNAQNAQNAAPRPEKTEAPAAAPDERKQAEQAAPCEEMPRISVLPQSGPAPAAVGRERRDVERSFSDEDAQTALERMNAYALEALESISLRANAFRAELAKQFPSYRTGSGADTAVTEDYRTPPVIRAVEDAVMNGRVRERRDDRRNASGRNAAKPNGRPALSDEEMEARREASRRANALHQERLKTIQRLADEVTEELPREFFDKLTGGIALTDRTKKHPQSDPQKPLLVLGEYRNDPNFGRSIMLYGGSILKTYGRLPEPALKKELRKIIRHEFTHHIESLSGTRDLEIEDEIRLENYKADIAGGEDN